MCAEWGWGGEKRGESVYACGCASVWVGGRVREGGRVSVSVRRWVCERCVDGCASGVWMGVRAAVCVSV